MRCDKNVKHRFEIPKILNFVQTKLHRVNIEALLEIGGWWLVACGWLMVAGGWLMVAGGRWLEWLVTGGEMRGSTLGVDVTWDKLLILQLESLCIVLPLKIEAHLATLMLAP